MQPVPAAVPLPGNVFAAGITGNAPDAAQSMMPVLAILFETTYAREVFDWSLAGSSMLAKTLATSTLRLSDIVATYPLLPSLACLQHGAIPLCAIPPRSARPDHAAARPAVAKPADSVTIAPPSLAPSMDLVKAINRNVNRRVHQRSDIRTYGVEEYWARTGEALGALGDCEDIALEKRAELIEAGVAADRLFLATVYKRRLGLHTVLVARMAMGDFVLDSAEHRVLAWSEARFDWLRLQAPDRPMEWHRLAAI
ncbi:transglutaminase-like cysteine peptidase [Novosphingobium sp.]|uniref:transglutaminase-like cysteine peptidase n=1 Tax=Novosphingobium sp. TaxID=1874826 RepID=UPI003D135133